MPGCTPPRFRATTAAEPRSNHSSGSWRSSSSRKQRPAHALSCQTPGGRQRSPYYIEGRSKTSALRVRCPLDILFSKTAPGFFPTQTRATNDLRRNTRRQTMQKRGLYLGAVLASGFILKGVVYAQRPETDID